VGTCVENENLLGSLDCEIYGIHFTEGLGQTSHSLTGFEYYDNWNIQGYVKNGDTTGIITPDEILLGLDEKFSNQLLQIFPNPVNQNLFFSFSTDHPISATLKIFDPQGRLVRVISENETIFAGSEKTWDLKNHYGNRVQPGVYFCRYSFGDKTGTQKIIVSQ